MNYRLLLIGVLLISSFIYPGPTFASPSSDTSNEIVAGEVMCLPGQSSEALEECNRFGPTAYQAHMAELGITFPLRPVNGQAPDPSLTYVDIRYGEVVHRNAPVYASLEDAVKKGQVVRKVESAYSFISYTDEAVVDGKRFYMVDSGGWMTANDVSRIGTPSLFQGVVLNETPSRPFGWIYYQVESKRTPGFQNEDYTGHQFYRYQVVTVYATENIDGMDWYMIGPDEWIPEKQDYMRLIGRVLPNPSPPEGVENGRWIEVNLFDQTIAVYDQSELVYASVIASGIEPFWTRPGLFQIYQKLNATMMRGSFEADHSDAYYLEDVPWTMYYDKARALHGAYWHNSFGSPRSHGCVNLSVGDSRWIFDWAKEGDWVYVWDPSGKTPTDPALYGDGGA